MEAVLYAVAYVALALAVGGLARLLLPGKDEISLLATFMLGAVGMFAGALLSLIFLGEARFGGLAAGLVVAVLMLYTVRKLNGGGFRDPGEG
jgi:uncharacterized membrane protein YeaQ/YmgE (transglycosylase-associated protein family)